MFFIFINRNVHPDKCTETEIGPFPRNLNLSRATNSQQKKGEGPTVNVIHLSIDLKKVFNIKSDFNKN